METSPSVAVTIWAALTLYVIGEYGRTHHQAAAWPRLVWGLSSLVYLMHVVTAFEFHHDWSHAAASAYIARQTEAIIGVAFGVGLWINYAFSAVWIVEALWSRQWTTQCTRNRATWTVAVRLFFLFMILNGAVIFTSGPRRWLGIVVMVALVLIWTRGNKPSIQ